ncbi:MAG: hypothetical protein AAB383_01360 [Patescibacteria group bacterium]
MVSRQRNFPDDPSRFKHFDPDDGREYERYIALNPAHALDERDTRGEEELRKVFFDRRGNLRKEANEVVQQANLMQISTRARAGQIVGNRGWAEHRAKNKAEFDASPRTMWKSINEIAAASADRVIITRDMTAKQVMAIFPLDPKLISPTLLRNLGVPDPVEEKGLALEDQLTLRERAIPDVKRAFSRLEPIRRPDEGDANLGELRYFRMMRVSQGPREGKVVGTQTIGGQKILFGTDLRGAERRIHHIRHNYEEEIEKLTWIHGVILNLRKHLEFWKQPGREADLKTLLATMGQVVQSLENVEDEYKRKLLKKLATCTDVHDSLGRVNPGSKQADLTKALTFLGGRLQSIESISKYIGEDHAKVIQVVAAQKDPLKGVRERIQGKAPWEEQLKEFRTSMRGVKYQPDLGFARAAQTRVGSVNDGLATGRRDEARKEYVDLYVLCKMKEAYDGIWSIYRRISIDPNQQEPSALLKELEGIEAKLRDKSFASSTETRAYYQSYVDMYALIKSLKELFEELLGVAPKTAPSPEEVAKENKTLLGILGGLQGKSEVLDRLLAAVKANPQQNMMDLLRKAGEVDPEKKRETFKRMKVLIAEVDFEGLIAPGL